jgi:hypothetical protein
MLQLPPHIAARYRPATQREVHSRSFGQLKAPRNPNATGWEQRRGTLEDQAIFGPQRDFECACGTYRGSKYRNIICHHCFVKVTTCVARRHRFGHIALPGAIVHPLGQNSEPLSAVPVLPAALVESRGGAAGLADIYDGLVRAARSQNFDGLVGAFNHLIELLLPAVRVAHEWDLHEAEVLACGLALVPPVSTAHDTCGFCNYPLEGLDVLVCPGCGQRLR